MCRIIILVAIWPLVAGLAMPPARYDHHPKIPVKIVRVDTSKLCPKRPGMRVIGCATVKDGVCWILVTRKRLPKALYRRLIRHEYGHCNGWRH